MKVTIYISNYKTLSGITTFVNNFIKRMNKHFELTLLYDNADTQMLFDVSDCAAVKKIDKSKKHQCDCLVVASQNGLLPYPYIKAKKVINVIHSDYDYTFKNWSFKYIKHPSVTHQIAVSQLVKKSFESATPYKIDKVIYNLLDDSIQAPTKPNNDILTLVTLSRLSKEKGFDRMLQLAEQLEKANIKYIWNIWGGKDTIPQKAIVNKFKNLKSVIFHGITTEPLKEIAKADYLVHLSSSEGFCYSIYEAMQMKTPCVITPFESGQEQIIDGVNGYVIPFDMQGIDLKKIATNIPKITEFKELGKESDWLEIIL